LFYIKRQDRWYSRYISDSNIEYIDQSTHSFEELFLWERSFIRSYKLEYGMSEVEWIKRTDTDLFVLSNEMVCWKCKIQLANKIGKYKQTINFLKIYRQFKKLFVPSTVIMRELIDAKWSKKISTQCPQIYESNIVHAISEQSSITWFCIHIKRCFYYYIKRCFFMIFHFVMMWVPIQCIYYYAFELMLKNENLALPIFCQLIEYLSESDLWWQKVTKRLALGIGLLKLEIFRRQNSYNLK
jgi:hypothetical protein